MNGTAPDGYPVHGWVVRPAGDGPHPVLLMIHGGPFAQYGWRLFDEAQVYAGAGYAVVYGNPRGSSGYGEAHGRAVRGNVGEVTADRPAGPAGRRPDERRPRHRPGRGARRLARRVHDHLARRHARRPFQGGDLRAGGQRDRQLPGQLRHRLDVRGLAVRRRRRLVRQQSPLTYADKIDIPMLIIHSEQDWRCPVEQAQRLFVALKRRGTPVEMLLFPGEGHELSRSGRPSHRVARFDAILEWFGRHV